MRLIQNLITHNFILVSFQLEKYPSLKFIFNL